MPDGSEQNAAERQRRFVERARQALLMAEAGGPVYDGPACATHLRQRVRAAREPGLVAQAVKPAPLTGKAHPFQRSSQ